MKLSYQSINFDYARARAQLRAFDARWPGDKDRLDTVVVGDAACHYRLMHMLGNRAENAVFSAFCDEVREAGRHVLLQLPVTVKQSELGEVVTLANAARARVDGALCGDLGVLASLADAGWGTGKLLVLHGDVVNRTAAEVVQEAAPIAYLRPLFLREAFLRADVGLPRDIPAYGPTLLSCSTFCVHCGDLPTACDFSCPQPKPVELEGELCHVVGRALYSERRMDLLPMLGELAGVSRASVLDLGLGEREWRQAAAAILGLPLA